jgi:hypothetical protein
MSALSAVRKGRVVALAALLAGGIGLSACGSSSPSASSTSTSSSTTTTTSGNTGSTGNTGTSGNTGSTGSTDTLSALTTLAQAGQSATFSATYTYTASGKSQSITFAQSPPKSLFKVGTTALILTDGSKSTYCGATTCYTVAADANPLLTLTYLFDGTTFADSVQMYSGAAAAQLATEGISLSFSNSTYAGQPSKCVTVHDSKGTTKTFTWCVATNGILDDWTSPTAKFALTAFTASPPSSDFTLPPGDKVIAAP